MCYILPIETNVSLDSLTKVFSCKAPLWIRRNSRSTVGLGLAVFFLLIFLFKKTFNNGGGIADLQSQKSFKKEFNIFNNTLPNKRYSEPIVPNVVHYLRINRPGFSALEAACVLSVLKHQRPDKIIFHSNQQRFVGTHWENLLDTPGFVKIYELKYEPLVSSIFDHPLANNTLGLYHAEDFARIRILRERGGMFLANDTFLVRSLDELRHYEIVLGAYSAQSFIVAHQNASLLKQWWFTYKNYDPEGLHFSGEIPPDLLRKTEILALSKSEEMNASELQVNGSFKRSWRDVMLVSFNVSPRRPGHLNGVANVEDLWISPVVHEMLKKVYPEGLALIKFLSKKIKK